MRGSESFDGKIAGNRQMVDRYNEAKKRSKPLHKNVMTGAQPLARPHEFGGESGGARETGGHDEIKNVVGEHGAAVSHHIMRTAQGYHSITHHEDGHVHHADHPSLEEAHAHGAAAFDDTEHMGDMDKDDEQVAAEKSAEEESPNTAGSRVGFMS